MTVDREQVRREISRETALLADWAEGEGHNSVSIDEHRAVIMDRVDALLAELEQAERDLAGWRRAGVSMFERAEQAERKYAVLRQERDAIADALNHAEQQRDLHAATLKDALAEAHGYAARLAAVPTLVEALKRIREGAQSNPPLHVRAVADKAIAAYEQAQG